MASASAGPSAAVLDQNAHVYKTAIEKLKETISSTDAVAFQATSLEDVRKAVKEIEESQRQRQSNLAMYLSSHRVGSFLNRLEKYSTIAEVYWNGNQYLPWIWGPMKLMLQLSSEYRNPFNKILSAYELIGVAMRPLDLFDWYYAQLSESKTVQAALAKLYDDIMEFHCRMYKFFQRKAWHIIFEASWNSFQIQIIIIEKGISDLEWALHNELDFIARRRQSNFLNAQDLALDTVESLYKPLSFQKAEIRLLTFSSPQTETAFQCSIIAVPLPKSPPYIALSYTWGNPNDTMPIIVNNVEVQITVNLSTALLRLRAAGVTHVWADALCINQGDSEERTAQVGRMGAIFRKASEVAVWLGPEQRIMEQALQYSRADKSRSMDAENRLSILPIFKELLSQPYWKRVWIIQEIAVASNISVYCGEYKIGWDQFVEMCLSGAGNIALTSSNNPIGETISEFATLLRLRNDTLAHRPIKFLDALHRSRSSLSTDPRDKLYALLGLTYDGRHFIPEPNYMNSVTESFTDFATALIEGGELLDFIYLRSASRRNDGQLPSWVPDWSGLDSIVSRRQLDYIMNRLSLDPKDSGSKHVRKRAEIDGSRSVLVVNSFFVDTIDGVGTAFSIQEGDTDSNTAAVSDEAELSDATFEAANLIYQIMGKPEVKTPCSVHQIHGGLTFFRGIEFGFSLDGAWEHGIASCDNGQSLISRDVINRFGSHSLTLEDGYIRLFWKHEKQDQIYSTRFLVASQTTMWPDFWLGRDACDELANGEKHGYDERVKGFRAAMATEQVQQLKNSLMNDMPRELLPSFHAWLAENYSFMIDRDTVESWSKAWVLENTRKGDASQNVGHFLRFMQSGRRLLRTQTGRFGWVHPQAQKGDRIARIFGCSQLVVLRACNNNSSDYQVVGDVLLSGVEVEGMPFDDEEVQCLKIL